MPSKSKYSTNKKMSFLSFRQPPPETMQIGAHPGGWMPVPQITLIGVFAFVFPKFEVGHNQLLVKASIENINVFSISMK
jgi:hypothetical protein